MASAQLAALAFDLARQRLDKQERVLDELRSRTGVLLAASSLAASFLGQDAFGESGWGLFGVTALVAFIVTMGASVFVLLPRDRLIFALVGSAVYEQFYALEGGQEEVHRRLAYDLDRFWEENDTRIRQIRSAFAVAATGLVIEVLALVAGVADTIA
jgi:hypothetical protein